MNSFTYGPANTQCRHASAMPWRAAILCLFHPDCNRWSRILTGSAKRTKRWGRLICSGRGLPVWHGCLLVTASGESHPALKQNSSSMYCMREISKLQPLFRKSSRGEGGSGLGWYFAPMGERTRRLLAQGSRGRYAQRDGRLLGERLPVIVCLTWAKRVGNTYRVSFGRRNADAIAMNTPRRLCGTMPPTHVSHPPTSFMSMWFSRTSDLRISAAKSPSRHRLHILKYVRVCPHEHACGIRSGARQAHVFKLCTRTCAQI